jgi:peptidylprolyl isomerase
VAACTIMRMETYFLKLIAVLILSAAIVQGVAQTTAAPQAPAHPTRTRHATGAAKPAPGNGPKLPPNVPPVQGTWETAYALRYIDIKPGDGPVAEPNQFYTVHYTGWLASDGTKFDASVDRGEPITFFQGAHRVIPGWDTGFSGMRVGGKRRLFIPYQLAYGEQGRPPVIPPKSDLIFDMELISVSATPPAPPAAAPEAQPSGGSQTPPADHKEQPQ